MNCLVSFVTHRVDRTMYCLIGKLPQDFNQSFVHLDWGALEESATAGYEESVSYKINIFISC